MKTLPLILVPILLLMVGAISAFAQYDGQGYVCYACPVCGSVFSVTPQEAASANPYDVCHVCYSAYLGTFVQVPCQTDQAVQGYDQPGYVQTGNSVEGGDQEGNQSGINGQANANSYGLQTSGNNTPALDPELNSNAGTKGKILMVLSPQDYQQYELDIPMAYFVSENYDVFLASKGVRTATAMNGANVSIDLDLKGLDPSPYRAVVFVGGEGVYYLKLNEDPDYIDLAKKAVSQKKLVGAICLAPWILADANLLQGKIATAAETDHIKSKGAVVVEEPVVQDGNIITANGPDASQEFAEAIVSALEGSDGDGNSDSASNNNRNGNSNQGISQQYKCTKCSYIYDPAVGDPENGIPPGTPFEDLPSNWKCPWCSASKSQFVKA